MGKTTKNVILYRNGKLPERLSEILGNADENDLRILLTLMMSANDEGVIDSSLSLDEILELDSSEVNASLKFWRGAGFIGSEKKTSVKAKNNQKEAEIKKDTKENVSEENNDPEKHTTAHKGGVISHTSIVAYESAELADILEKRKSLTLFINEAQRILGKTINYYDTSLLVGFIDQLGFDEEAVLAILAYSVRLKRGTVRYAEKIALNFYDEGIVDSEAVIAKIEKIEASAETVSQIRVLFGLGSRGLSTSEKKLFTSWSEKLGYGIDVIRLAYDITIDSIHDPAPKYTNSILERWYAEGLHTAADIEEYIKSQKEAQSNKVGYEKSYDIDEFFEASLKRSYEEFDKKYGTDDKK